MDVQHLSEVLEQAERERAEKLGQMGNELGQAMSASATALFAAARQFGEGLRPLAEKGAQLEAELRRPIHRRVVSQSTRSRPT